MFSFCRPLNLLFLLLLLYTSVQANNEDLLTEDSVVLITGAAGFIGSELAMALHRTYTPKKLILIDSLENGFAKSNRDTTTVGHRTEQDLSLLEFKRQRVFHMLQTIGTKAHFYRVDFRPNIPEFYDPGQVPVLHHILRQHYDITHIVHLADHYHGSSEATNDEIQAVPRVAGQPKAGLMESLLEHLRLMGNETNTRIPHFTYASSYQVYNHNDDSNKSNPPPFDESKPITTPSSLAGASKLLDEILAQTYYKMHDIYSVGLRFFSVYGPWGLPGSALFEMTERAVTASDVLLQTKDRVDDVWDYIYIDDAIDAIMTAMQLRLQEPFVVNVGTGQGATLRSVARQIQHYIPSAELGTVGATERPTISYASMDRAKQLLGLEPRVSLAQGLEYLLAWQYDRAFPYGGGGAGIQDSNTTYEISTKGIASCSRYDSECLRGMPVFPCASECSHQDQCIPTAFDDVLKYSRLLTANCETVMYTIALEETLASIPSATVQVSTKSKSHVDDESGHCNVAFVNEASPLVQRLKTDVARQSQDGVLMHGFWSVVPMTITKIASEHLHVLKLLPKMSPGLFFSNTADRAIYCDPDVIFDSIPALLEEASMQPYNERVEGATAVLIGRRRESSSAQSRSPSAKASVQEHAYRMIRIAVFDEMTGDDFQQHVDSSFIVHTLNSADSRFFRCDVYGEVVQWDVDSDNAALEFVMGLHDMWSRVIARKDGQEPWWTGDDVETVPSNEEVAVEPQRRRLQEDEDEEDDEDESAEEEEVEGAFVHNGFGVENRVPGEAKRKDAAEKERDEPVDDEEEIDDAEESDDGDQVEEGRDMIQEEKRLPSSPSSYDVWMGVLSSTETKYFARVVSAEAVGAVHLDEYSDSRTQGEL